MPRFAALHEAMNEIGNMQNRAQLAFGETVKDGHFRVVPSGIRMAVDVDVDAVDGELLLIFISAEGGILRWCSPRTWT